MMNRMTCRASMAPQARTCVRATSAGSVVIAALLLLLAACSTVPPQQEVTLPSQALGEAPPSDGLHRLVIFNDSNRLLFGLDDSAKINVFLGGKGVGQVDIRQYVVVEVPGGRHSLEFFREDVGSFRSSIEVDISGQDTFLRVYARPLSNSAQVVEKPADFSTKFKPAYPPTASGEGVTK